ncbi:phage/plasmid replication protein [Tepidibacillus infernus]|uniref:phage/plasmid replication domain-containing protein n=1 Tax=Tepidibacillus infernus TaxID=1806172 RepID=UPI003B6AE9A1
MFDTIACYTLISLENQLFTGKNGWKRKKGKYFSFFKNYNDIRIWYYPLSAQLRVEFSIPKIMYGSNARLYNPQHFSRLIELINFHLNRVLQTSFINFEEFIVTRIDVAFHYKINTTKDFQTYIETIKKLYIPYTKKQKYDTGNRFYNKSKNLTLYSKEEEIIYRISKNRNFNQEDVKMITNMKNIMRFEIQMKKGALKYKFKENRTVSDIVKPEIAENIINDFLNRSGLRYEMLEKSVLLNKIQTSFSPRYANNVVPFILDLNEKGMEYVKMKYPKTTIYRYLTKLKEINLNAIYFTEKVSHTINFSQDILIVDE